MKWLLGGCFGLVAFTFVACAGLVLLSASVSPKTDFAKKLEEREFHHPALVDLRETTDADGDFILTLKLKDGTGEAEASDMTQQLIEHYRKIHGEKMITISMEGGYRSARYDPKTKGTVWVWLN